MRLSLCPCPAGPLECAPVTALWPSIASTLARPAGSAYESRDAAETSGFDGRCQGYWTADERYVLRVVDGETVRWFVGDLGELSAADRSRTGEVATVDVVQHDRTGRLRTMLVGHRRGGRLAHAEMRMRVGRLPHR